MDFWSFLSFEAMLVKRVQITFKFLTYLSAEFHLVRLSSEEFMKFDFTKSSSYFQKVKIAILVSAAD